MVDAVGGITVNVEEEVDDPYAGSIYIAPGEQTLSGEQALVYARARNYSDSTIQRQDNQLEIATALMQKVFDLGNGRAARLRRRACRMREDGTIPPRTSPRLSNLCAGMDVSSISKAHAPGYIATNSSGRVEFSQSSSWSSALIRSDRTVRSSRRLPSTPPTSTRRASRVVVRNGGGIYGRCRELCLHPDGAGFQRHGRRKRGQPGLRRDARRVQGRGQGGVRAGGRGRDGRRRTTNASAYYSFDSDVLVMIGRDYAPTS